MRHQQVGPPGDRLVDDGQGRVDGEEDPAYRLGEVTRDETHAVPGGSTGGWVEVVERRHDVTQHEMVHVGPAGLEPTTPAV